MVSEDELPFIFNMLSDPTRLKLIQLLPKNPEDQPIGVCDLGKIIGMPQPNLSHHLKLLRCAGLIHCDKKDGYSFYRLDAAKVRAALQLVESMLSSNSGPSSLTPLS